MTRKRHELTLAERLVAAQAGAHGPQPCKLCVAMAEMNEEDLGALEQALSARKSGRHVVSVPTLYSILKETGYDVPRNHIQVHRQEHS